MQEFTEDDLLLLSGIQHIAFCERQWALIHIEKQWVENVRTVEGHILHKKVDDPYFLESRGDFITARSIPVVSYKLGLYGIADVIEFIRSNDCNNSVTLPSHEGFWKPNIVEYKRGKPKNIDCDKVQLCAQSLCIEEMFNIIIDKGSIYYGETRHRQTVEFDEILRNKTQKYANRIHQLFNAGITPKPIYQKGCRMCSLIDICIPKMPKSSVRSYLKKAISGDK